MSVTTLTRKLEKDLQVTSRPELSVSWKPDAAQVDQPPLPFVLGEASKVVMEKQRGTAADTAELVGFARRYPSLDALGKALGVVLSNDSPVTGINASSATSRRHQFGRSLRPPQFAEGDDAKVVEWYHDTRTDLRYIRVPVVRDGRRQAIAPTDVVVGDILVLMVGTIVTGDAVVIRGSVATEDPLLPGQHDGKAPTGAGTTAEPNDCTASFVFSGTRVTQVTTAAGPAEHCGGDAALAIVVAPRSASPMETLRENESVARAAATDKVAGHNSIVEALHLEQTHAARLDVLKHASIGKRGTLFGFRYLVVVGSAPLREHGAMEAFDSFVEQQSKHNPGLPKPHLIGIISPDDLDATAKAMGISDSTTGITNLVAVSEQTVGPDAVAQPKNLMICTNPATVIEQLLSPKGLLSHSDGFAMIYADDADVSCASGAAAQQQQGAGRGILAGLAKASPSAAVAPPPSADVTRSVDALLLPAPDAPVASDRIDHKVTHIQVFLDFVAGARKIAIASKQSGV